MELNHIVSNHCFFMVYIFSVWGWRRQSLCPSSLDPGTLNCAWHALSAQYMFVELNWNFNTYPKPVINNKQKYCWLPWAIRKKWNDKKKLTIQKMTFRCLLVRKTKYLIKELELSGLPPTSKKVRGWRLSSIINGQWFNQLCLSSEVAIRNPKAWGSESFQIGEHMKFLGGWLRWRGLGSSCLFPHAFFFFFGISREMWDSDSLTRDQTHVPCIRNMKS